MGGKRTLACAAYRINAAVLCRVAHYNMVPVKVIEPDRNLYETLEFTPQLIGQAMDMGRKYVADNWLELKQFLRV